MANIKKINIYMGVVGQAYVDKETAKKKLEAAKKNVLDVKHIIYLINHNYEEDIILANDPKLYPLTAQSYNDLVNAALTNAQDAKDLASQVRNSLEEKKNSVSKDSQNYDPIKYEQLINLINALESNDIDMDYTNGGNIITADNNISQINALSKELDDILEIANKLLEENEEYVNECQVIYDQAVAVFEAYIPEAVEDQASKSDRLEAELLARLKVVAIGLENAQNTTDAINRVSAEVQEQANDILRANVDLQLINVEEPTLNGDKYCRVINLRATQEGTPEDVIITCTTNAGVFSNGSNILYATLQLSVGNGTLPNIGIFNNTDLTITPTVEIIGKDILKIEVGEIPPMPQEGGEPGGDEPGGDEPGGDQPGGDQPGGDEPGGDEPGGDEPGGDPETHENNYFLGATSKESFEISDLNEYVDEKPNSITVPATSGQDWTAWIYPESWGRPTSAISSLSNSQEIQSFNYDELNLPLGYIGMWINSTSECTYALTW